MNSSVKYDGWAVTPTYSFPALRYEKKPALPSGFYSVTRCEESDVACAPIPTTGFTDISVSLSKEQHRVIDVVSAFWGAKEGYAKLGFPYRRGVLMYGSPGCGKTTVIRQLISKLLASGGYALQANFLTSTSSRHLKALSAIRESSDANIMVIIEDIDQYAETEEEEDLLGLLDGVVNTSGVLFIATTNNKGKLSGRFTRASRFDEHLELEAPSNTDAEALVRSFITDESLVSKILGKSSNKTIADIKAEIINTVCFNR